jgi:hypothetical protein
MVSTALPRMTSSLILNASMICDLSHFKTGFISMTFPFLSISRFHPKNASLEIDAFL